MQTTSRIDQRYIGEARAAFQPEIARRGIWEEEISPESLASYVREILAARQRPIARAFLAGAISLICGAAVYAHRLL